MLLKNNISKILQIFLDKPSKEFHLREIARMTNLSTTAVRNTMNILVKEKLITKRRQGIYDMFKANRESEDFREIKKFYTIRKLKDTGLISFIDKVFNYPEVIILFGSASKGEDIEKSDVDLFILGVKKEISLEEHEKKMNRKIKLLIMDREDFERAKRKNPELINNLVNGIIIKGYMKVI